MIFMNKPAKAESYHHGDLKRALLEEAERILETGGVQALSLRAMSRAVGVTHAAPANHFGDLTGLLSELAADGYRRFCADLTRAIAEAGAGARARNMAMGRAYVAFARAHPGLFSLMFRSERLDMERASLKEAISATAAILRDAVAATPTRQPLSPIKRAARGVAMRSLVHGYTVLMLDGRLKGVLDSLPGKPSPEDFFDEVLDVVALK
jgi:AcrR family transcriptional regulator